MIITVFVSCLAFAATAGGATSYRAPGPARSTAERFVTPTREMPPILNPPGFRWLPGSNAGPWELQLSRDAKFASVAHTFPGLKLNLFVPPARLAEGAWFWRVRPRDGAWSEARGFTLASGLPSIPVPAVEEIVGGLAKKGHPRLFVTKANLRDWRAKIAGTRRADWERLLRARAATRSLNLDDPPKPATTDHRANAETFAANHTALARAEKAAEAVQLLALSHLLTGNAEDGAAARRILLKLSAWDPDGATSRIANDTAFRTVLNGLVRGYDWLADSPVLSASDKRVIEGAATVRGRQFLAWYKDLSSRWPYSSHQSGSLMFFGEAGTVFADSIPEAREWLRLWVYVAVANYPAFGRSDGSWSEGSRYWRISIGRHLYSMSALGPVLRLPLLSHPFLANTGYFAIYANPPWDPMSGFGDGHQNPAMPGSRRMMSTLAFLTRNPDFQWYLEQGGEGSEAEADPTVQGFLTKDGPAAATTPRRIEDLPPARAFPDTGLVVMRTNLLRPESDVQFLIRSNPFGSVSHAHADQGNFYLSVGGEPLLVPSGYYQNAGYEGRFGGPHHAGWTWQSWAHNVPLIGGKGQASRSPQACGQLEQFEHTSLVDYARVDATRAYTAAIGEEAVRAFERNGFKNAARIGSAPVASYRRSVVFLRPATFVIFDDIDTTEAATVDWLLHSPNEFAIDGRKVVAKGATKRAVIQLLEPAATLSQSKGYGDVPTPAKHPRESHLTASLPPQRRHRIVSVISVGEEIPSASRIEGPGWAGVSLGPDTWIAFAHSGGSLEPLASIRHGRVEAEAAAVVVLEGTQVRFK